MMISKGAKNRDGTSPVALRLIFILREHRLDYPLVRADRGLTLWANVFRWSLTSHHLSDCAATNALVLSDLPDRLAFDDAVAYAGPFIWIGVHCGLPGKGDRDATEPTLAYVSQSNTAGESAVILWLSAGQVESGHGAFGALYEPA